MSAEYTPTTDVVRATYLNRKVQIGAPIEVRKHAADFDRWLESLIAQVRVDTLRDAAAQARKGWAPETCPWVGFLDDRADRIERS